jgi:hypothetical protein
MPALFFWLLNGLPIHLHLRSIPLMGGTTQLEFLVCGFIFPLIAVGLGWNANRRCENKTESCLVMGFGLLELIIAVIITLIG